MNGAVVDLITQAFYLVLMLSMPPIIVASVVGVLFSVSGNHSASGTNFVFCHKTDSSMFDSVFNGWLAVI